MNKKELLKLAKQLQDAGDFSGALKAAELAEKFGDSESAETDTRQEHADEIEAGERTTEQSTETEIDPVDAEEAKTAEAIREKAKTFKYPHQFSGLEELVEKTKCTFQRVGDQGKSFIVTRDACGVATPTVKHMPVERSAINTVAKSAWGTKAGSNPDFLPTDKEYEQIMKMIPGKNYKKEDFKVYYITAADTRYDRHCTRFAKKGLGTMSGTSYECAGLKNHNYRDTDSKWSQTFDSKVVKGDDGEHYLMLKDAVLNSPENQATIRGLETFNNSISVGVRVSDDKMICDKCNVPNFGPNWTWCGHYPGWVGDDGTVDTSTFIDTDELLEKSIVTVPAQRRAAVRDHSKSVEETLGKVDANLAENSKMMQQAHEQLVASIAKFSSALDPNNIIPSDTTKGDDEKMFEELMKLLTAQFEASKASNDQMCESLKAAGAELKQAAEHLKQETSKQEEVFQKQIVAQAAQIEILAAAQVELNKNCSLLIGRDIAQIEKVAASARATQQTQKSAEAEKQEGTYGFYRSFATQETE